jgi:pimeloyl-ACP methyl ester carboxylesterase
MQLEPGNSASPGSHEGILLEQREIPFQAGDGMPLKLRRYQLAGKSPDKGPVLLVHGAGVRGHIFRPPLAVNFVTYLAERGYDVWVEEWRASIDLPANPWTLDQAAVFDHPMAVKTVVEQTGATNVKAVIHCQGSTSFLMSAMAGLVPQVDVVVSNAVSLYTIVPTLARLKITYAMPVVSLLLAYMNPQWGLHAPTLLAKILNIYVRAIHHECSNAVCKWSSFTYGTGFPTLWRHENLDSDTHEWIKQEFAAVPLTFFKQMSRCVARGNLVSFDLKGKLPDDFAARPPQTDARFSFFTGDLNVCFLPESQRRTFERFEAWHPGRHSLHVIPGYGHLDIFLGHRAVADTYPLMAADLEREVRAG